MALGADRLGLDDAQAEAVAHGDGPLLIFAGAGSGKTRVITHRIARLVSEGHVAPFRVLAVTFTNKAAHEMRDRLGQLLPEGDVRALWVGTFHATCARLLRQYAEFVGRTRNYAILDDGDQRGVVNRIVKQRAIDDKRYPVRRLLSAIHRAKQEGHRPGELTPGNYFEEMVQEVYAQYETELAAQDACDFDDLLLHLMRLAELPDPDPMEFPPPPGHEAALAGAALRAKFRHVLVDEFQDVNSIQYRLVRAFSRDHHNVTVVGDDDQSIYAFRGANVQLIRGFAKDFPGARVVRLEQNYRSTGRIVRAALSVIRPSRERVPKELWTKNAEGEPIAVVAAFDERDEAQRVVHTIRSLVSRGGPDGMRYREIGVLYRTHAQSRVLEEAFRAARIPHRITGGLRFFERGEVKNLLAWLRLLQNPRSDVDLLRIINVPARGIGATTIERLVKAAGQAHTSVLGVLAALVKPSKTPTVVGSGLDEGTTVRLEDTGLGGAAVRKLAAFYELYLELVALAGELAPAQLAEQVLERSGYGHALLEEDRREATTRLQNLGELLGSIREYERSLEAEMQTPTLSGFLEHAALVGGPEDEALRAEDAVQMMTIHAAKGLEFRAVMMLGLEEDLFPFRGGPGRDEDVDVTEQDIEDERRLAYVAVTRARERLCIFYASQRTLFGQTRRAPASRFLRELEEADQVHAATPSASRSSPVRRDPRTTGHEGSDPRFDGGLPDHGLEFREPAPRHPVRGWERSRGAGPGGGREAGLGFADDDARSMASSAAQERRAVPGERWIERDDAADGGLGGERVSGRRARHSQFGEGRVVSVSAGGLEPRCTVEFPGVGTKVVLARFLVFPDE